MDETNDKQYERNISELEKVQPKRVLYEEIILHPGTNVIPEGILYVLFEDSVIDVEQHYQFQ